MLASSNANVTGSRLWTAPYSKPGNLCAAEWECGEPKHHHNCCDCEAHCRLGITAQGHEDADPSDYYRVETCRCAYCVARREREAEDEQYTPCPRQATAATNDETVLVAAIRAALPKCPTCGGDIDKVQFIAHQIQRFYVEMADDGQGGTDVLAYSQEHDTLDTEPNTVDGCVMVECENQHDWAEPRLRLKRQDLGFSADWEVLP